MKPFNIIVIGTGMYTCGRGTDEYGTIMPAIFEWKKYNKGGETYICGTSPKSIRVVKDKISGLIRNTGTNISIKYFPEKGRRNPECYKEAINRIPHPACAIIVVPDNLHAKVAGAAMAAGLHTLVVKPLAPTLKEVRGLVSLQKIKKVYCAVEFHKRLDCANLKLRDAILQGKIGDPLYFLVEYSQRKSIPSKLFREWVKETNVFQYLGVHYVDIIYFVTKALPIRAMATGQKGWLVSEGIGTYDSIQATIEWKMPSGKIFTSHILTNWIDPEKTSAMSDQKIKVIGTKGRFESDQKRRGITIVTDERGTEEPNPYFCSAYGEKGNISYSGYGIDSICQFLDDALQIERGILKIDDLEDKRPTFRQSLVSTAVLEGVNYSLKNNSKWVAISKTLKI